MSEEKKKTRRGFAAMSPELHRALARRGGRMVHELGTGHRFTKEEARAAGALGGAMRARRRLLGLTKTKPK